MGVAKRGVPDADRQKYKQRNKQTDDLVFYAKKNWQTNYILPGSTNYYWCPPPPQKLLSLPVSISWPAASLPLRQRNLWARPRQTSYKQTNRRILGPTPIVIGEQTELVKHVYALSAKNVIIRMHFNWTRLLDSTAKSLTSNCRHMIQYTKINISKIIFQYTSHKLIQSQVDLFLINQINENQKNH